MKKSSETQTLRAGCSRRSQILSPRRRPLPGGAWRPKFNQLEIVTTCTYGPSLVKIDARNFELLLLLLLLPMYWFKWRCHANDAGALYRVIITVRRVVITINSYRGNRHRPPASHKHTHKHTDRTDYNTLCRVITHRFLLGAQKRQATEYVTTSHAAAAAAATGDKQHCWPQCDFLLVNIAVEEGYVLRRVCPPVCLSVSCLLSR